MEPQPDRYTRGQEIRERLDAIGKRLDALILARPADRVDVTEAESQVLARDARDAAERAAGSLRRALYWSAQAHDRAAQVHDRAVVTEPGDSAEHQRQAAFHREAAEADRLKADRLPAARMSRLLGEEPGRSGMNRTGRCEKEEHAVSG